MSKNSKLILQITDMHLFADTDQRLLGVNTSDSFDAVVDLAFRQHPEPELILLTGDLSQDETTEAYERIADRLTRFSCPKYWIPGNHDDVDYIEQVFSQRHIQNQKHIILNNWQLILLDTKKMDAVEGYLVQEQLDFMETVLGTYPELPALIFLHHHPLPVGSLWLDRLMLTNAEAFWKHLEPYHHVKAVICGHVHQEHESTNGTVQFYATPSTCFQFKRYSKPFGVEELMPGYRTLTLHDDGSFDTEVHRLQHFDLNLDPSSGGY